MEYVENAEEIDKLKKKLSLCLIDELKEKEK